MKLSVITVCRNAQDTIGETLSSVSAQKGATVEHIIVDGASTDATMRIVNDHGGDNLRIVSEPDAGIYDAMNKGLALATGDVIAFLNADDAYNGNSVAKRAVQAIERHDVDSVFGDVAIYSGDFAGRPARRYRSDFFSPSRLKFGLMPAHPAMFVRRSVFDKYGFFATDYRIAGDFEFVARAFGEGRATYRHYPEIWVNMRAGGASSRDVFARLLLNRETLRACRVNGIRSGHLHLALKYLFKLRELRP